MFLAKPEEAFAQKNPESAPNASDANETAIRIPPQRRTLFRFPYTSCPLINELPRSVIIKGMAHSHMTSSVTKIGDKIAADLYCLIAFASVFITGRLLINIEKHASCLAPFFGITVILSLIL